MPLNSIKNDVGNYNDYDDGGGGTTSFDNDYDYHDTTYHDNTYSGGSSSDSNLDPVVFFTVFGLIFVTVIVLSASSNKNNQSGAAMNSSIDTNFMPEDDILNAIHTTDPNFSKEKFISFAQETFIKLQNAWTKKDWESIRLFESPELFNQHSAQLKEYISEKATDVIEDISIRDARLKSFRVEGENELLTVFLKVRMKDYVIDDTTKKVVKSDPNKYWIMDYNLVFERKKGTRTADSTNNLKTVNCPNCGAVTEITSSGRCKYCDSIIMTDDHGWVLSDLKGINKY